MSFHGAPGFWGLLSRTHNFANMAFRNQNLTKGVPFPLLCTADRY